MQDLIIIGGGPAGLSAGIYAKRLSLDTLLIEKAIPGGLAATVDFIENYPGFPEGISGVELMRKIEEQARGFGLKITNEEVLALEIENDDKIVHTKNSEYKARAVIIATGTHHKKLGVPGEDKLTGRGVSYCAVCDGPLFKGKDIAIVGCGNSGIQEGLFLLKFVNHITFVEFLEYMTADPILQERIHKEVGTRHGVSLLLGHMVTSINGEDTVSGITVKNRTTGQSKVINVDGAFIYVGLVPNTQWLKGRVKGPDLPMEGIVNLDPHDYIITDDKLETSVPGVFAVGDVRAKPLPFFQVISASSDGAFAAFAAEKYIEGRRDG